MRDPENRPRRSVPGLCVAAFCALVGACPVLRAADPAGSIAERPFSPRLGQHGPTMFTVLSPEQTGLVTANAYADPRMWGNLYQQLVYGETGTGIAVGDYDNDGLPDLLVVSKSGGCRLFHNLGNWRFEDVTEKAGLGRPKEGAWDKGFSWIKDSVGDGSAPQEEAQPWEQGATFVDVNNDGLLDIYICRFGAPNLLYINQGDGTFKEEAARVRPGRHRRVGDGGLLRLRPRRMAGCLHPHQPVRPRRAPGRPAGLPLPQQPGRHLHGRDREGRDLRESPRPLGDLVGLSTATAGPTSTSPTTTALPTSSTATTGTARSPT